MASQNGEPENLPKVQIKGLEYKDNKKKGGMK